MARVLVVDDAAFMRKVLTDAALAAYRELVEIDPAARVVICSALGQETKVLDAIKDGAKDFVVKPFERERLLGAVGKALSQAPVVG